MASNRSAPNRLRLESLEDRWNLSSVAPVAPPESPSAIVVLGAADENGHGTHVAGTVASSSWNSTADGGAELVQTPDSDAGFRKATPKLMLACAQGQHLDDGIADLSDDGSTGAGIQVPNIIKHEL